MPLLPVRIVRYDEAIRLIGNGPGLAVSAVPLARLMDLFLTEKVNPFVGAAGAFGSVLGT